MPFIYYAMLFISISVVAIYHFHYVRDQLELEEDCRMAQEYILIDRMEKLERQNSEDGYQIYMLNKRVEKLIVHIGIIDKELKSTISLAMQLSHEDYEDRAHWNDGAI